MLIFDLLYLGYILIFAIEVIYFLNNFMDAHTYNVGWRSLTNFSSQEIVVGAECPKCENSASMPDVVQLRSILPHC